MSDIPKQQVYDPTESAYRWLILGLAVLTYVMCIIPRFAWPPLIPVVAPILNIQMTQAGAYMTAFYIGYVITQVPAGLLADRFGVRGLLALTLVVQGLANIGLGIIDSYGPGFALRMISGLAGGCVYAACFRALVQWFRPEHRGLAFGIFMATPSLGVALTNALVPSLEGFWGWRGVFLAIGVFALACSVAVFTLVREVKSDGPANTGPRPSFFTGLKTVLQDRNIRTLCLCGLTYIWCYVGFMSWGNTYLKQVIGLSNVEAGAVITVLSMIGIPLSPLAGFVAGKSGKGLQVLIMGIVLVGLGVILFGQTSSVTMIWTLTVVTGVGFAICTPLYSFVVSTYSPPQWAATTGGVTSFCWQFGGMLVPVISGLAIDLSGFSVVWWILGVVPLLAVLLLLTLKKPQAA